MGAMPVLVAGVGEDERLKVKARRWGKQSEQKGMFSFYIVYLSQIWKKKKKNVQAVFLALVNKRLE